MVRMGTIRDDFFRKRILRDRFAAIVITVIILVLFYFFARHYLKFAAILFALLFLIDLPGLIRKYRNHRRLITWLSHHRNSVIFAYTSNVKYLETIEKYVIPFCPPEVSILKINDHKMKGEVPRQVWFELAKRTRMPQLPVVISIHHRSYKITQVKRYLNDFMGNRSEHEILLDNLKLLWTPHNIHQ